MVLFEDKYSIFFLSLLFLINKPCFQLSRLFHPSTLEIMCVPSLITVDTHFLEKGSVHEPAVPKQKHEFVLMLYLIVQVPPHFREACICRRGTRCKEKNEINGIKYRLRNSCRVVTSDGIFGLYAWEIRRRGSQEGL